jgi:hypothetical protein
MRDVSRHKSMDVLQAYVRDADLFRDHAGAALLRPEGSAARQKGEHGDHRSDRLTSMPELLDHFIGSSQ